LHAERQAIDEVVVETNIAEIHEDLERKRNIGAPAPDQRTGESIVRKSEGCRPDSYVEIKPCSAADFGRGVKSANAQKAHRRPEKDHQGANPKCHHKGPEQGRPLLRCIGRAKRLCDEAGRSHAQEAKTPKQEVENHRSGGYRSEKMCLPEPADDRRIGNAEQGRR
jgi:hypothetical protein